MEKQANKPTLVSHSRGGIIYGKALKASKCCNQITIRRKLQNRIPNNENISFLMEQFQPSGIHMCLQGPLLYRHNDPIPPLGKRLHEGSLPWPFVVD